MAATKKTQEKETVKVDKRYSGILLHPTSLPSPYGIGDMGQDAYDFVDFLEKANTPLLSYNSSQASTRFSQQIVYHLFLQIQFVSYFSYNETFRL